MLIRRLEVRHYVLILRHICYNTLMGTYLNEGSALYAESVNSEIHVDKSLLIRETAEDEENTRYMQFLRCLLKECRTRLISDAVTGRIDLREAVA